MSDNENFEPAKKGVSRRTVTKAMAWAVPAIALATPVPAFAASGSITINDIGACKSPGNGNNCPNWQKGYILGFEIGNSYDFPITVTFSNLVVTDPVGNWTLFNNDVVINPNGTETIAIGIDNQLTSENISITGTVTACYYDGPNNTGNLICIPNVPFSADATAPCVQTFGTNCPPKG